MKCEKIDLREGFDPKLNQTEVPQRYLAAILREESGTQNGRGALAVNYGD